MSTKVLVPLTVFLLVFLSQDVLSASFPPPVEKCHIDDEPCMIAQADNFLKAHPHGIPELGMPDLEPLHFDKIDILGSNNNAAKIDLFLTDVNFYNYSKMTFSKLRGYTRDTSKPMKIVSQSHIPHMVMKAKYKASGKVLVLPVTGEGDLEWTITDTEAKSKMQLSAEKRDGKTFLKIDDYKIVTKSKNVKIHLTNLFNGDKDLSENMLKLLNDNWAVLSQEIQPVIDDMMTKKLRVFMEKFFVDIPYEDFFLPDKK